MTENTYTVEVLVGSRWALTITAKDRDEAERIAEEWVPAGMTFGKVTDTEFLESDRSIIR